MRQIRDLRNDWPAIEFHPEARIDALGSYKWYAQYSEHAAVAFQEELEAADDIIQKAPDLWAIACSRLVDT